MATIRYQTGNPTQPKKVLHIEVSADNTEIIITRNGMGAQSSGSAQITRFRKELYVETKNVARSKILRNGQPVDYPLWYEGAVATETWTVDKAAISGTKTFTVQWVNPPSYPLVGPDIYFGIYYPQPSSSAPNPPFSPRGNLADEVVNIAKAGMNYGRIIVPSNCWLLNTMVSSDRSLFNKSGNIFNLASVYDVNNSPFDKWMKGMRRARDLRINLQIDMLDNHMFNSGEFEHGELHGNNNTLSFPSGLINECKPQYYDSIAQRNLGQYQNKAAYSNAIYALFSYFRTEVSKAARGGGRNYPIIGDGNESTDIDASQHILNHSTFVDFPKRAYGGQDMPSSHTIYTGIQYICLHHIGLTTQSHDIIGYQDAYNDVLPILNAHSGLRVLFSTDGTGEGNVRGSGGRPSFPELASLYSSLVRDIPSGRLGGLGDIKVLAGNDYANLLTYWKNQVYSVGQ